MNFLFYFVISSSLIALRLDDFVYIIFPMALTVVLFVT